MTRITDLPPEVIEELLLHLDPIYVAAVALCSSQFNLLVYGQNDQALWRGLYLRQPLDDPRLCVTQGGTPRRLIDWKGELHRIVRLRSVLRDGSLRRPGERLDLLKTLLEVVTLVPPLSDPNDSDRASHNLVWAEDLLKAGAFLENDGSMISAEEKQLCARMHVYFGLTSVDVITASRVRSRAFVYDMRNYGWENEFGPFDGDGCVNWVHVQALHHVVSMHIMDLKEDEDLALNVFPMSLMRTQIVIPPGVHPEDEDWAGVAGAWRVSFCFCDHRELLRYNESATSASGGLDSSIFEETDFGEVFRSLDVEIHVVGTTVDPKHPHRPIIYFAGEMPGSSSTITGQVKMSQDGQVRWQFVSGDQGNAVWSSQGVQIGGLRSSFGILGSWTTIFHDDDDPVGPFWLRRPSNDIPMNHVSLNVPHPPQ